MKHMNIHALHSSWAGDEVTLPPRLNAVYLNVRHAMGGQHAGTGVKGRAGWWQELP